MFGKFFASTFTGSMVGSGSAIFAVWGYVIANTRKSQIELNPKLLAAVIGSPLPEIEKAIEVLCSPDPHSRSKTHDGRRLVREGQFAYFVPNYEMYRGMRDEESRREYNRTKKAESRERLEFGQNASQTLSANVSHGQPRSAQAEAEEELRLRSKSKPSARKARGPVSRQSQKSASDGESRHKRIEGMIKQAWEEHNPKAGPCPWGPGDGNQLKVLLGKTAKWPDTHFAQCLINLYASEGFPRSELPVHFLPRLAGYFAGPRNTFNREVNGNGQRRNGKLTSDEIKAEIDAAAERMAAQSSD